MQTKLLTVLLFFFVASLNICESSCSDLTVNGGEPWYDRDGPLYNCAWYEEDECMLGNSYENFGLVANEACCACGGGLTNPTISPTQSPWNRNNDDNEDDDVNLTRTVLAVLGSVVGLFLVIGCLKKCAKNSSQNLNNNIAASTNLRTRPTQRAPQHTQYIARIVVDERDIRREFILTNIIHKKVVTKSSQYNDDTQDDNKESATAGTSQDNTQSDEIDEREAIFPHEAIIRERSERITSMRLSLNHEAGDEEQGGAIIDKKDDICIETLRSIRSGMNLELESLGESLYSPRSCPICCEDYVKGDDVAWSRNEECCHAFHTDCIVPWLMDHDDCPMCRCVYVKEGVDEADC